MADSGAVSEAEVVFKSARAVRDVTQRDGTKSRNCLGCTSEDAEEETRIKAIKAMHIMMIANERLFYTNCNWLTPTRMSVLPERLDAFTPKVKTSPTESPRHVENQLHDLRSWLTEQR